MEENKKEEIQKDELISNNTVTNEINGYDEINSTLKKIMEENEAIKKEVIKIKEEKNKVEIIEEKPRQKDYKLWKEVF